MNPDDLSNSKKFFRESNIPFTWRGISRRMIVRDNDGMGPPSDRFAKHFPWMHRHGRDTALRDRNWLANRVKVRINRQDKEILLLGCFRNNLQKHLDGRCGRTHRKHPRFVTLPSIMYAPCQSKCRRNLQELRLTDPFHGFRGIILVVFPYAGLDCSPIRNQGGISPRRIKRRPQPSRQFVNLASLRSSAQNKTEEFFIGHLIDRCHRLHFLT